MAETVKRVLIADDDDNIRAVIVETVRAIGLEVVEASDGVQAMGLIAPCAFDLALLDISMPGYTGIEICAELKKSPEGELVPVILLTARDRTEDKVEGLDAGAEEYITKPFQYKELQARVKACLRIRELNLKLLEKSRELARLQDALILQERQKTANQIGGAAAHAMGQPLAAMLLNLHLIESLPKEDLRFESALRSLKSDSLKLKELLEQVRSADARTKESYFGEAEILKLEKKS